MNWKNLIDKSSLRSPLAILHCLLAMVAWSPISGQSITDGLVAHWPLDGDAVDASSNNHNGTSTSVTVADDRKGLANGALSFTGGGYVEVAADVAFELMSTLSVSAWVKTASGNNSVIFGSYGQASPFAGYGFAVGAGGCNAGELAFWSSTQGAWICSNTTVNNDAWHHVAVTLGNGFVSFYIDGLLDVTLACAAPALYQGPRYVGNQQAAAGAHFQGSLDEVRIYNRPLTATDVRYLSIEPEPVLCESIYCDEGRVGIGVPLVHPDYRLAVDGNILAEEIKVQQSQNWPDYVFDEDYNLRSLEEVQQYIQANHHLPEVPSAAQVESEGLMLGEINAVLLKKIEELTLYLLQQDQKIEQLSAELESLKKSEP